MLNRSAVVIRYKQPFVDWINLHEPDPDAAVDLADANEDTTVYLVDVEDEQEFERWLILNHDIIFEELLNDWYSDAELWPGDRSPEMLKQWCAFEFHSLVFDTGGAPIEDDESDT